MARRRDPFATLNHRRSHQSFGPIVVLNEDANGKPMGEPQAMCVGGSRYCMFLHGKQCSHVKPSREVPDTKNTPDWCAMRESALRDVAEMIARDRA